MLRLAVLVIFFGTIVGAMMPGGQRRPAAGPIPSTSEHLMAATGGAEQVSSRDGTLTLNRNADGHFYTEARVNGMPVQFLVDTGATGIALSRDDAQRAAIPLSPSMNAVIGQGAGGDVRGQYVHIDRVEVGHKIVEGSQGVVIEGGQQSLLGQSFLSQFGSVEIHGDTMELK